MLKTQTASDRLASNHQSPAHGSRQTHRCFSPEPGKGQTVTTVKAAAGTTTTTIMVYLFVYLLLVKVIAHSPQLTSADLIRQKCAHGSHKTRDFAPS